MKKMNISLTNGYCDVEFKINLTQTLITIKGNGKTIIQQLTLEDFDNDVNHYSATVVEMLADFFSDDFVLCKVA